ncbi:uncharacterized protein B0H18DRAFT_984515 [Fomitopsis serialis]|uniref:uncharacterized protein n=1 Tax=Fomitopsis serialis TaxID=139415 RepID=UPI0020077605|nr:uncharacterized protein B0H18DRAFT_984515 [Neoantrodia serialis]KAH9932897.1 hypothetical protein B0H18DRAFT_984515 [Neoantrodia serialis]
MVATCRGRLAVSPLSSLCRSAGSRRAPGRGGRPARAILPCLLRPLREPRGQCVAGSRRGRCACNGHAPTLDLFHAILRAASPPSRSLSSMSPPNYSSSRYRARDHLPPHSLREPVARTDSPVLRSSLRGFCGRTLRQLLRPLLRVRDFFVLACQCQCHPELDNGLLCSPLFLLSRKLLVGARRLCARARSYHAMVSAARFPTSLPLPRVLRTSAHLCSLGRRA